MFKPGRSYRLSDESPVSDFFGNSGHISSPSIGISQYSSISSTTSFDSLDPVAAFYQEEITTLAPISSRPLSSALAIFSYRATRCFSSFELLSENDFGNQNLRSTECVQPGEVVSIEQVQVLRKVLAVEVKVVERIIEEAIQNRGVEENLKVVVRGTTYFDSMKMVSRLDESINLQH